MRVWVDFTNTAHVIVLRPLVELLEEDGHEVELTARPLSHTVELLDDWGHAYTAVGRYGGARRAAKAAAAGERLRAHGVVPTAAALEELTALVAGALASPVAERLRTARRMRTEVPFAFELAPPGASAEPLIVDGFIDVHAEEDEGALVVDYKTDALGSRDPFAAADEKYAAQRLVYALAALRAGAPRVEVVHLFLERPGEPASREFAAGDVGALEHELLALAEGIVGGAFSPAAAPHRELCQGCPGQPALCTWGPERTLADRPEGETFGDPEPVDVRAGVA